jgi:hypothetical protein
MVVARVSVALRYDYWGIGKRTKEGDEKRDVVLSGKNRRKMRGKFQAEYVGVGVCGCWTTPATTTPFINTTDGPRKGHAPTMRQE